MKKRNAKIISAILSLSIISSTITVSAGSYKIFEDSFMNMDKWKATTGTWSVKNGIFNRHLQKKVEYKPVI